MPSFRRWPVGRPRTRSGRAVNVIAHRGAHGREPENSLAAFAGALAAGADGVELDVRTTADGHLVCLHDWYLKRLTGASGRVGRTTIQRILEYPLVHPTSGRRRPVATLDEALTLLSDHVEVVLDLKREGIRPSDLELDTIRALREHGLGERVTISSFNPWVLRRVRQLAPEFRTALIAASRLAVLLFHPDYCDGLNVHHSLLQRRWFQSMLPRFERVMVWTVDRRGDVPKSLPDNICGLMTNRLDRWGARIGRKHAKSTRTRSVAL